jgi:hypothetical protein
MATVFRHPDEVGDPPDFADYMIDGRYDFEAHHRAEQEWIASIATLAQEGAKGDTIGEIIRFQRGDGYAQYLVWNTNPCELVWLPVGDAWRIDEAHERGLRTSDVREHVRRERTLRNLFGGGS